jgi:hypothetical protein
MAFKSVAGRIPMRFSKRIQDFLFHFTRWQHIGPALLLALPGEKSQVVPHLAQHWFRLVLDFRKQHFLGAHVIIIHKNPRQASRKPAKKAL